MAPTTWARREKSSAGFHLVPSPYGEMDAMSGADICPEKQRYAQRGLRIT
jgi:hypothetical protein